MSDVKVIAEHQRGRPTGVPTWIARCTCGWRGRDEESVSAVDEHAEHVVAMIREANTITTVKQLDALPDGAVIRACDETIWEQYRNQITGELEWDYPGDDDPQQLGRDVLPALVLWRPEDGAL